MFFFFFWRICRVNGVRVNKFDIGNFPLALRISIWVWRGQRQQQWTACMRPARELSTRNHNQCAMTGRLAAIFATLTVFLFTKCEHLVAYRRASIVIAPIEVLFSLRLFPSFWNENPKNNILSDSHIYRPATRNECDGWTLNWEHVMLNTRIINNNDSPLGVWSSRDLRIITTHSAWCEAVKGICL